MNAVPTAPLSINPVQFPFSAQLSAISSGEFISVVLAIVFIAWVVYTLVAAYHWLRYSRGSLVAVPALAVHVAMSGWLGIIAVSGFH